jgi:peptide/nickel transport system permease protein
MTRNILVRIAQAVLALLFLTTLVFVLVRVTGDPASFLTGPSANAADRARVRQELGLDRPLIEQYAIYMSNLAQLDLGQSYRFGVPVADLFFRRLPATVTMATAALVVTLAIAVPLGVYSAYKRSGPLDVAARSIAGLGQAVPAFWLGLLAILFFAVRLDWLPSGGTGGVEYLVLPALVLAFEPIARLTRLLRSSVIEELSSDYVTFHRINGVPERQILWRYVLRNAGLTSLTFIAIMTVGFLTGSVLVETVFVWPGIGRLLVEAIDFRDFAVIQGVTLLIGAAFIFGNLLVDLLYIVLNPRLRTA